MPVKYIDVSKIRSVYIDRERAKILTEILSDSLVICNNENKYRQIEAILEDLKG